MGNCLVTQLKGTVNNDNLVTMNEVHVKVLGTASLVIIPISGKTLHLKIIKGDGVFTSNNSTEINVTNAGTYLASITATKPCVISVKDKYDLERISLNNEGENDASYITICPDLVNVSGFYFSKKDLLDMANKANMTNLAFYAKGALNLNEITGYSHLTNLGVYSDNVNGNINTINSHFPNLQSLIFYGSLTGDVSQALHIPTSTSGVYPLLRGSSSNPQLSTLSWGTTRAQTARLLELINVNLGSSLDSMLINQANLTYDGPDVSVQAYRGINVYGTLGTSTEVTNAIAAIKAKGLGVRINGRTY